MKKCKECETYDTVKIADKSQPSNFCKVAPQSMSEEEQGAKRWTISYPLIDTHYCYYCTKKKNKRIMPLHMYGQAYYKGD